MTGLGPWMIQGVSKGKGKSKERIIEAMQSLVAKGKGKGKGGKGKGKAKAAACLGLPDGEASMLKGTISDAASLPDEVGVEGSASQEPENKKSKKLQEGDGGSERKKPKKDCHKTPDGVEPDTDEVEDVKLPKKNKKNEEDPERIQEDKKGKRLRRMLHEEAPVDVDTPEEKPKKRKNRPAENGDKDVPKKQMAAVIHVDPTALARLRTKVSSDSLCATPNQFTTPNRRTPKPEASPGSLPTPKAFPD